jgi:hypothetical protein
MKSNREQLTINQAATLAANDDPETPQYGFLDRITTRSAGKKRPWTGMQRSKRRVLAGSWTVLHRGSNHAGFVDVKIEIHGIFRTRQKYKTSESPAG